MQRSICNKYGLQDKTTKDRHSPTNMTHMEQIWNIYASKYTMLRSHLEHLFNLTFKDNVVFQH